MVEPERSASVTFAIVVGSDLQKRCPMCKTYRGVRSKYLQPIGIGLCVLPLEHVIWFPNCFVHTSTVENLFSRVTAQRFILPHPSKLMTVYTQGILCEVASKPSNSVYANLFIS